MEIGPNIFVSTSKQKDPYKDKSVHTLKAYTIDNKSDFPVKIQFDITGSTNARFTNNAF